MFAPLLTVALCGAAPSAPRSGLVLKASTTFRPGTYICPSPAPDKAAITVSGNGIVVDFRGACIEGTKPSVRPDERAGVGLDVSGRNVVIKNAVIRGYKIGLFAHAAPGLKLVHCDFSYNWKQHLRSTLEREDLSDWQSYHHNENREWMRYGAGAYLEDCRAFEVRGCRATGGQCGLMLTRCNHGKVSNNDFSFLSGVGLGMYRSSDNVVMHNKFDWCVRGFSYNVYNRGQDSAGILVFEQCNRNTFAYNSATHGGDGFFLWAGQQTMDTGKGGCNDNLLYANDFSHAPANGIEATFSRNEFVHNLCAECDYGIWGGYSFDTVSLDNGILASRIGAAFEHSQNCAFRLNTFLHCKEGIRLWGGPADPSFAYAKAKDVRSVGNGIDQNRFIDVPGAAVWLTDSDDVTMTGNVACGTTKGIVANRSTFKARSELEQREGPAAVDWVTKKEYPADMSSEIAAWDWRHSTAPAKYRVPPLKGGQNAYLPAHALRGRRYILVDEWGPYDFRYPRLWPRGENAKGQRVFEVLGPVGKWKVTGCRGGKVIGERHGRTPAYVTVATERGDATDLKLSLQFVGATATDYLGNETPAGTPIRFAFSEFVAPIAWQLEFFQWDKDTDPRRDIHAFDVLLAGMPLATVSTSKLDYAGYGAWAKGVPENYFAISANGDFTVPAGKYALDITTDDGCRVFLDGQPLQLFDDSGKQADAFKYQGPTDYSGPMRLTAGKHHLFLEYFQIDGYKTIQVRLRKA